MTQLDRREGRPVFALRRGFWPVCRGVRAGSNLTNGSSRNAMVLVASRSVFAVSFAAYRWCGQPLFVRRQSILLLRARSCPAKTVALHGCGDTLHGYAAASPRQRVAPVAQLNAVSKPVELLEGEDRLVPVLQHVALTDQHTHYAAASPEESEDVGVV